MTCVHSVNRIFSFAKYHIWKLADFERACTMYPSFILHVLEIENVTALCNSEKREPHIEQSVCLLQRITGRIIRTRVSLPTRFVLNFDRG